MSKIKDATTARIPKPFVKLPSLGLEISTNYNDKNQITSFECTYKGVQEKFEVKNLDILAAWKQLETFIAKQSRK